MENKEESKPDDRIENLKRILNLKFIIGMAIVVCFVAVVFKILFKQFDKTENSDFTGIIIGTVLSLMAHITYSYYKSSSSSSKNA